MSVRSETQKNGVKILMAKLEIDGVTYFSATELLSELGVSRQTLWRWRHRGKVPAGHRYRDNTILFTADEVELIRQYANRIEPTEKDTKASITSQLGLFKGKVDQSRNNRDTLLPQDTAGTEGFSDKEPTSL
jgi:hypothetical protein